MSCFDNTTVYIPPNSSPATYKSYMSRSKNDYLDKDTEKVLKTTNYDLLWQDNCENCANSNRFPPITKLRNILTDTIANITKDTHLQKNESVELTLEIQLMGTENTSPSHSLVEVTIVQHNKQEDTQRNNSTNNSSTVKEKTSLKLEPNICTSETASQKRRSWFQRVISWQKDQPNKQDFLKNQVSSTQWRNIGFDLDHKLTNINVINNTINNTRNNFIKVLPEEMSIVGDLKKGYRKVSPEKKSPRMLSKPPKPSSRKTGSRKNSAVKKISSLFLPSKKGHKSKKNNNSACAPLHSEIYQTNIDEGSLKCTTNVTVPVPKLNKVINHILGENMNPLNNARGSKIKDDPLPLKYQNFFEHISESNCEIVDLGKSCRRKQTRTICTALKKSYSETCCVHLNYKSSNIQITKSNSISDCRMHSAYSSKTNYVPLERGDSSRVSFKRRNNIENWKQKRKHKKNAEGDGKNCPQKQRNKGSKTDRSKKSLIEWNGQTIKVNKEVKNRIEMLIVNELQNLALKEGMECDVKALTSNESSFHNNIEKVSSFICELDISDKKFKKLTKSKHHVETKDCSSQILKTKTQKHSKQLIKDAEPEYKLANSKPVKETQFDTFGGSKKSPTQLRKLATKQHLQKDITDFSEKEKPQNDVKVTFMNTKAENWSVESTTLKMESDVPESVNSKLKRIESPVFKLEENDSLYKKAFSSGFVKKIESSDATWKNFADRITGNAFNESEPMTSQLVTVTDTKSTVKYSSTTSNENQSVVDIELDIENLERILEEAKQDQNSGKVILRSVKCNPSNTKEKKKQQSVVIFTGKNSPEYTIQLLKSAAGKLEKYVKKKKN